MTLLIYVDFACALLQPGDVDRARIFFLRVDISISRVREIVDRDVSLRLFLDEVCPLLTTLCDRFIDSAQFCQLLSADSIDLVVKERFDVCD